MNGKVRGVTPVPASLAKEATFPLSWLTIPIADQESGGVPP